ncbi:zinc-ribbon domain-containing protein [Chloroflexota bacterium]
MAGQWVRVPSRARLDAYQPYKWNRWRSPAIPVVANIVKCKKCNFEIRSNWKYCPSCGDKIVCAGKYQVDNKTES